MKKASNKQTARVPRGIRNNNPLNIRIGNTWLGEVTNPTDSEFEVFVAPEYGLRAAFLILRRYIRKYGRNTIRRIVSAWAPANENNTNNYIAIVSQRVGISPDEPIRYEDKDTMLRLVHAMAYVEVGQVLDFDLIEKGYLMA